MLTYKRKLILTAIQQQRIDAWIGTCRFMYNMGLEIKKEAWKNKQEQVHKFELMKQISSIRDIDWIKDVPRDALDDVMKRLDKSYRIFFNGGGFPDWARSKSYNSFTVQKALFVRGLYVSVPKIGAVKMYKDSQIQGSIKIITFIKDMTGYYACIVTDAAKDIQCKDESQVVGLDMGITHFYVDSNGQYCQNPKYFKKYEAKLRVENRSLSRKKKGSNSWKKQAHKLALLHHKISNVRKDFLHKESTKIAKANHTVILEDLNVAGMKRSNLGKSISDAGWGNFRRMLSYKTNVIAVDPKYTSQTCNHCGEKDKKSRISQSKFVCTSCGEKANSDENAAKNIMRKGIPFIRKRESLDRA